MGKRSIVSTMELVYTGFLDDGIDDDEGGAEGFSKGMLAPNGVFAEMPPVVAQSTMMVFRQHRGC